MPHPQPTQPSERIDVIDILRGFAIFGILLVNMIYFAWPIYFEVLDFTPWISAIDRAASTFITFFGEAKFFTLFSMLFGLGLALQMQRAEAKGINLVPLYARRLLVLLLIGAAHAFLFWWGDILIYYALLGFALLLFRKTQPRRLLTWAFIFLALPLLLNTAMVGLMELARSTPEGAAELQSVLVETEAGYLEGYDRALEVYGGSSFTAMIPQRIGDWVFATMGVLLNGMLFVVFAMFLVGLYVGKRRLLHDAAQHLPLFRRVFGWGALIGIIGNLLYITLARAASPLEPSWWALLGLVGYLLGAPALSMTYASGIVLLTQSNAWHKRLKPLAAVGRTALSNYLLQTLVCTTLFYGYGLGLYGRVGPALGLVFTVVIFALQIPLSNWWVKHFRFGPLEWLWRCLTYGQLQPIRLRSPQRALR